MLALRRLIASGRCARYAALDFHRIDPALLFQHDHRPRNIVLHQDMAILRDKNCDIMWRHAPWLYERLERTVLFGASHIFTVRRSAMERYSQMYPTLAPRISFLPTWFDMTVFRPAADLEEFSGERDGLRSRLKLPTSSRILVTVGRLDRQKDPLLLLRAFSEVAKHAADVNLVLIGDGVLRHEVQQASASLNLQQRVHLLGVLPPLEIAKVLRASDLFVLASAYEGMPIAMLEALAVGTPVVSTQVGEVSQLIREGVNGRLSRDRTPLALAEAIVSALREAGAGTREACIQSVIPFRPETVLQNIYQNHRLQTDRAIPRPAG